MGVSRAREQTFWCKRWSARVSAEYLHTQEGRPWKSTKPSPAAPPSEISCAGMSRYLLTPWTGGLVNMPYHKASLPSQASCAASAIESGLGVI